VTIELPENAIDPELWKPSASSADSAVSPKPSKELELIFIGRLVRWKGAEWLIDAFAEASRQVNCRLTVVGDHGDERERLTARAAELGIASKVAFLGWQPQARCAELLSAADALVLPSVFECGGAVVLEAMACEKPVIAAEWGGPADYLDPSCGFLVPPRSPEYLVAEVAKAIVALATDDERRVAMGRAGRQKVLREFSWPAKIEKMIDIYRQVLGQPRAVDQSDDVPASHERTRAGGAPERVSA
jgi:glycosyltransferase involved in cell wall biosynthesis